MRTLVYKRPGKITLVDKPKSALQTPGDAVVRIALITVCGTDLHIIEGDVPTYEPGHMLGHEDAGIMELVGAAVISL